MKMKQEKNIHIYRQFNVLSRTKKQKIFNKKLWLFTKNILHINKSQAMWIDTGTKTVQKENLPT